MDPAAKMKLIQYLDEAHATEQALVRTLQAHIAMTPASGYRSGLERHLEETRGHASRLEDRLRDLGEGRNMLEIGVGLATGLVQSGLAQTLALSKGPIDLVRGQSGEEKLLKNAKDECATEALEIATYDALEHLARRLGDERTAELAASIRSDEERMLEQLRAVIRTLTDAVVDAEVEGIPRYEVSRTGAAETARGAVREARETVEETADTAEAVTRQAAKSARKSASKAGRSAARQSRKVPGAARAQGEAQGAVASAEDLPIKGYDELNAEEIVGRLKGLSHQDLGQIDAYERKERNRSTVLDRVATLLEQDEPWPGYDDQSVADVKKRLDDADAQTVERARAYERAHKDRRGVLDATEKELSGSSSS